MPEFCPPPDLDPAWGLHLDFDGTLVELAERPEAVVVPPGLPAQLDRLRARLGGALSVVSGRRLAAIDGMLAPLVLAGAGQHGLERRDGAGRIIAVELPPHDLDGVRAGLAALAAADPRLLVEDKGLSVALHYRQAPERVAALRAEAVRLCGAAARPPMLVEGKFVFEFRPPGIDKGSAIAWLQNHAPFAARKPVFLGDDVTDEDGFRAVNALGGITVRVGDPARTEARFSLPDPAAVRAWLRRLAA